MVPEDTNGVADIFARPDPQTGEVLVLYCPRRDVTYEVHAVVPDAARVEEIQQQLAELLFAGKN